MHISFFHLFVAFASFANGFKKNPQIKNEKHVFGCGGGGGGSWGVPRSISVLFSEKKVIHYRVRYPISKNVFQMEQKLHRLNSKNYSVRDEEMLRAWDDFLGKRGHSRDDYDIWPSWVDDEEAHEMSNELFAENRRHREEVYKSLTEWINSTLPKTDPKSLTASRSSRSLHVSKNLYSQFSSSNKKKGWWQEEGGEEDPDDNGSGDGDNDDDEPKKSEHFEVIKKSPLSFKDIGGYDKIKEELKQCIDILVHYDKYVKYNVRIPQGLILEGPPGNGKTLLAKGLAGEAKMNFIAVSGSEFQEKYVGVGAARVRELFGLAKKHKPCIVFIDEIDAIGRRRSSDSESSSSERDNTLNELLIGLDGFKNSAGVFVIGATNRVDLLDPALVRPGRIDKKIFIGPPDAVTREAILLIHLRGKPADESVVIKNLVALTQGLSGAQIENLLNEALLNALRENRDVMKQTDIEIMLNRILAGWQPTDHVFSETMIDRISIHELGHALVGLLCKNHNAMKKVIINLSSPKSPAYTVFEGGSSAIYTREALMEHLMILLAGRIAEEVVNDVGITTGAINDFEEALKLAEKMVLYYGMGKRVIYPSHSETYKALIDEEVHRLIHDAYERASFIIRNGKAAIVEGADMLKKKQELTAEELESLLKEKYPGLLELRLQ
jgi:cell division protease FtsH